MARILIVIGLVSGLVFTVACSSTPEPEPDPAPPPVRREVPPPPPEPEPMPEVEAPPTRELPKTASGWPLVGLVGMSGLAGAGAVHWLRRRLG